MELQEHIIRFKENEPKVDTYVNGDANTDVIPSGGGNPYPTQAKAVAHLMNAGGYITVDTLATLTTITPTFNYQTARTNDTGLEYSWNGTAWTPTGKNYLHDAIQYVDINVLNGFKIGSNSKSLLLLVDSNDNVVMSFNRDGSLFLNGVDNDVQNLLLTLLKNYKVSSDVRNAILVTDYNDQLLFSVDYNGKMFVSGLDLSIQDSIKSSLGAYNLVSNAKSLLLVTDSNNNTILNIDLDGNLFINGVDRSIQDAVNNIVAIDTKPIVHKTFEYYDAKYEYLPSYMKRLARVFNTGIDCAPVPLFSSIQNFNVGMLWVDSVNVEVTQPNNRIPIGGYQPVWGDDIGVVHPQIWSFEQTVAGYKYWLGLNPYTNGNENIELPFIYGSNDPDLKEWELIPTFPQPFEADPVYEDGSYSGHLSDSGFCYDPKTGDLVFFWRKNLYYDFATTGKRARYALLASKYNGETWSDIYTLFELTEEQHATYNENMPSPNIVYNPNDDLFYMFYLGYPDGKIYRRTSPTLDKHSWSERELCVSNSTFKFWHMDMKFVGNKLVALIHCDDLMQPDNVIDKLIFAVSDDYLNFTCSQQTIVSNAEPHIYKSTFLPKFIGENMYMKIIHTSDSNTTPQYQLYVSDTNQFSFV